MTNSSGAKRGCFLFYKIQILILTFGSFECINYSVTIMADVAQLVRALVCGTRCREFKSLHPPQFIKDTLQKVSFFVSKIIFTFGFYFSKIYIG